MPGTKVSTAIPPSPDGAIVPTSPALLILWDIDHTLIETGGVGSEVYAAAFQKVTGHKLEQLAAVSGRTEPVIFRETLALHGLDDPGGLFARFADEQARGYADRISDLQRRGRALPGAARALDALATRDDAVQSVLTGNTRPSAEIKLRAFGLDTHLDLDAAAYGTDSDDRASLVAIARERAARHTGHEFGPQSTLLIGDTPADVTAARDGHARIIAVASGDFSPADLAEAGATTVLAGLSSTAALIAAIYPAEPGQ
ncbi:MAG: haloacid dehalogenase-like hydrolase [Actinomycetota bacterium]|nr:haloacid dehalogenase-like hydrolase [Actinomycetota bacterium]